MSLFDINPVRTPEDLLDAIVLIREYVEWLNIDLAYQGFETEIIQMPGKYAPPTGELLLARRRSDGVPIGCVALRALADEGCCEMKRLYVRPEARGARVGKHLIDHIIKVALERGYREMKLDTLQRMEKAIAMYEAQNFVKCEPYYESPQKDTVFLSLDMKIKER
jgi:ribosomal protein S18 acetylase RimI-like enzyme